MDDDVTLRLCPERVKALRHVLREWTERATESDDLRPAVEQLQLELGVSVLMYGSGYRPRQTGGGCESWSMERPTGTTQEICTRDSGLYARPEEEVWLVGIHGDSGSYVQSPLPATLGRAVGIARYLRDPLRGEQTDVELV